jgi:hypothetical protein
LCLTLITSCGHSAVPNALAGRTPTQVITRATQDLSHTSFHYESTQSITLDTSRIPVNLRQGFTGPANGIRQTIAGDVQSERRFTGTLSSPAGAAVRVVLYDGTGYASGDGRLWREAPFLTALYSQISFLHTQDLASHLSAIEERGSGRDGGVAIARFVAGVSPEYLTTIGRQAAAGIGAVVGAPGKAMAAVLGAMHVQGFETAYDIDRATGRLVQSTSDGEMTFDLAAMGAAMGAPPGKLSGTLVMGFEVVTHLGDYGAHISVTRPASSGTMTIQEFAGLLKGAHAA